MKNDKHTLESIHIPEPCHANWAQMSGGERQRFCDQCQLHVHNLSAMPRVQAEAVLARRDEGEKVCVRVEVGADGQCVTTESPSKPSRPSLPAPIAALALALGTGALVACRSDDQEKVPVQSGVETSITDGAQIQNPLVDEPCELMGEPIVLQGRIAFVDPEEAVETQDSVEGNEGAEAGIECNEEILDEDCETKDAKPEGDKSRILMGTPGPPRPKQD